MKGNDRVDFILNYTSHIYGKRKAFIIHFSFMDTNDIKRKREP